VTTAVQHLLLKQNALDGAPRCFMLPRFSLAEPRRRKESCENGFAKTVNAFPSDWKCC